MFFMYVLRLRGNFWYVGTTSNLVKQLKEFRSGGGADWVRMHGLRRGFNRVYRLKDFYEPDADKRADVEVKKLMSKHGIDKVRGGSFSKVCLSHSEIKKLSKELWKGRVGCVRCGDKNHWTLDCFAKYDIEGNLLTRDRCKRCGRFDHWAYECPYD